ncbi:MAG: exodeoxyribonuclease VII large subunit [Clostridia bacterium]|nr:exodeoxyribonuclease VII large subunit [Clostridia bacterium]
MEQSIAPRTATVSQINGYIKKILDHNIILNNVWIKGEISNYKRHTSGHMYITLKDEGSVLKAVMFRSATHTLDFIPADGMKVLARGRISVYEASGAYQLYIEEMRKEGVGDLYIAYEKLKKRLDEEGLFLSEHKKPIPKFPKTVGVVTASTGAAVRDIINVISRRYPVAKILLYPTLVQGDGAKESIAGAIEYFNKTDSADTLIVGRGGGSIEDLWAFNEEIVARAIYNSHIPIISAVGHETDFTIADFVADLRAPTPSAAAEIAVPNTAELKSNVLMLNARLTRAVMKKIENGNLIMKRFSMRTPQNKIDDLRIRIDNLTKRMEQSFKLKISEGKKSVGTLAGKLDALSPLQTLSRGYAIATLDNGTVVRSVNDIQKGDEFNLHLKDGNKHCTVQD